MTALDGELLEEITGALAGCLGTIDLALAVCTDEGAARALQAVALVIASSHEHLSRVDAMVFHEPAPAEPLGPVVMGQEEGPCEHLDYFPMQVMGAVQYMCAGCGATVTGP